ncbi:MAG: hypothetical protein VKI81_04550 [Synechococcaceae cyanobacterium]|nr:hypothetical protein [Synechococcaceae cyanobacterium]
MAATRLSDSQKRDLVARFCDGASTQELAVAFGCSANTVTRLARAALDPGEYERLKQARGSRRSAAAAAPPVGAGPAGVAEPSPPVEPSAAEGVIAPAPEASEEEDEGPGVLAIDDADDFGADDDTDVEADEGDDDLEGLDTATEAPAGPAAGERVAVPPRPLAEAALPASVYMLVDKTVELQARPLSEFPELGRLPREEQERQALLVFANPRQAKRQCGRSQRVIKLPDPRVLERTSAYLLAQGISRVVLEGALYSLPGS